MRRTTHFPGGTSQSRRPSAAIFALRFTTSAGRIAAAGAIAGALRAKRLLFLTDVPGVLDKNGQLIGDMTIEQARALIADGTISGGMIPKVENCIDAVNSGVEAATILDGRVPHALLLEIFTESGLGTMVRRS